MGRGWLLSLRDFFTYKNYVGSRLLEKGGTISHQGILHLQEPLYITGSWGRKGLSAARDPISP
jgi:hypothetical protein